MSEQTIKLRVPADVPEGFPEHIEQGNLATALPVGGTIEIEDRRFADWLIRELGLKEEKAEGQRSKVKDQNAGGKK